MDFDDAIFWVILIIGICAAIAFWPITLAILIFYFYRKNKKEEEYKEREYKIKSLQNAVVDTQKDIEAATNQKTDLRKRINDAYEEREKIKSRLADTVRFQSFVAAVTQEDSKYTVPNAISALNTRIIAQKERIAKLEAEDKSLASKVERLKSSLEAKNKEISSLQAIQATHKKS